MRPHGQGDRGPHTADGHTLRAIEAERSSAPDLADTMEAVDGDDTPLPDLRQGRAQRRIEDLVLQTLFDVEPEAQSIGRYRVLDQIGRGGMGTVLAAYDEQLDRKVAVKVLDSTSDPGSEEARRLEREAQALARLSHPNVVTVHEVGEADGEVYVVMEFLRGQSLDAWIGEHPHWREVLEVFLQAGQGIVAAHAAGLVHRDLKPHNIMRTNDGAVKVLDFGLARVDGTDELGSEGGRPGERPAREIEPEHGGEGPSTEDRLTRTGAVLGTPAYMAPEQHRGEPADARTDQYGFCAALYEALYWRLPFEAPTLSELITKILDNELTPPPGDTRVPTWLHRVVRRGLSLDPADRWPSMQALLHALERDPARVRRRRLTVAALGLSAGLGGYGLSRLQAVAEQACPAANDEVAALWSPERRDAIAAAFSASGSRLAADTLDRIEEPVGDYAGALGAMRMQACEAHREGQESDRLFGLRTACLDVRRAGFEQLMRQFERADAATVDHAAWAVASLPHVDPCGDVEALTAAVPPPEDPAIAQQVQQQREVLASARSMGTAGAYDEAIREARAVLQQAHTLSYTPLVAEAELRLGDILRESNQHGLAHEALTRSVRSALASVHYEAAAEALALRMWIVADHLQRPREGLADGEIADAMLERLGRPARLQWLLLNNRAVAQFHSGALVEAERSYRSALEAARAPGEHALPVEVISTRANLAILQSEGLGRPDLAARELRSARARAIELLGPEHPRVFTLTSMLAEYLASAGQSTEALEQLEVARRLSPPDAYSRIRLLVETSRILHGLRRDDASLRTAEEALALAEEARPDGHLYSAALWRRGSARVGLGELDEGLQDLLGAIEREEQRVGPRQESVALARIWAGLGLRRAGRLDEAIEQLEQALEITVGLGSEAQPALGRRFFDLVDAYLERGSLSAAEGLIARIADAQDAAGFAPESRYRLQLARRRGALLAARGDHAAARATYERACRGLAEQVEPGDSDLAACHLALAQVSGEGPPARALANRAADAYRQLGDRFEREHRQALDLVARLEAEATG